MEYSSYSIVENFLRAFANTDGIATILGRNEFRKMTNSNRLQTAVQLMEFEADENLLILAPTGARKTNVALLTVLLGLANSKSSSESLQEFNLDGTDISKYKVVYVRAMLARFSEVVTKMGML